MIAVITRIYPYTYTHLLWLTPQIKSAEDFPAIDIDTVGKTEVKGADGKTVTVEVFDCTEDHIAVLKECFDFDAIKALFGALTPAPPPRPLSDSNTCAHTCERTSIPTSPNER